MSRLLDLPAELRNNIYGHVLDDTKNMNKGPIYPWLLFRTDFITCRNLFLVNRQVYTEAKSLFSPSSDGFILYADSISTMHKLMTAAMTDPKIAHANFILHISLKSRHFDDTYKFLASQHGWKREWPIDPIIGRSTRPAEVRLEDERFGEEYWDWSEFLQYPIFGEMLSLRMYRDNEDGDVMVLKGIVGELMFEFPWFFNMQ